ncbi:DNA-binding transcriptional LysR family regulator [Phenylobacterium haematophilum]|uniref:DNA-binding transcriptional LysR family regulator n=1 Tax=Phenylobacterium haematophilum TaxID=98513 RepID=A0A839ZU92_9CAUL|nr:LysR family transcriptional regulator [Phenylobacterium haematophilum]MBB3890035.1 DNA-binding transcriptional LysR family regulator [Phenylobacterium haematophilum]
MVTVPGSSMNLRHIEVFHAVYQSGSVSAASRALNVSQPSVSKVLKHAESRIGFRLFRLVKGRLVPTDEAHTLFREVDDIYGRIESLRQTTRNLRAGGDGHIRLAVLPSLGLGVAPAAVARFRQQRPNVSFDIHTLHNDDILKALYERNSDLAVAYDTPRHPRLADVRIGSGELVMLYRKDEMPDAPERLSLDAARDRDLISLAGSGPVGALFASEVVQDDPGRSERIFVQTYYVAAALVRHGAGVAVVDEFTARASLSPELDFRPLTPKVTFGVHCIYLEDRPPSRPARDFIAVLQQTLAERYT